MCSKQGPEEGLSGKVLLSKDKKEGAWKLALGRLGEGAFQGGGRANAKTLRQEDAGSPKGTTQAAEEDVSGGSLRSWVARPGRTLWAVLRSLCFALR